MYSLIKGYISSANEEEEKDPQIRSKAVEKPQTKAKKAFRSTRSRSESSARYLSWENVSFLGGEIRKSVVKGFQWITYPSLEYEMSSKVKRKPPQGTKEYLIALRFNTTPSELTRINKLSSRMLFPGQSLFVPDDQGDKSVIKEPPSEPVVKPPLPLSNKENDQIAQANGDHETVKLTKDVSWEEEEEEGIANGVLLITPHSVMFKPNVSDPLVMDRGQDTYSIATRMTSVTSAAMYTDIAAMAIHDPLKPGRFYLDAATAQSLSRQNSIDAETTSTSTCGNVGTCLKDISEVSLSSKENDKSYTEGDLTDGGQKHADTYICSLTDGGQKHAFDADTYICSPSENAISDSEDVKTIVHEVLNNLINQIADYELSHLNKKAESVKESTVKPVLLQDIYNTRDAHSMSPTSEDSGIGCSVNQNEESKDQELAHRPEHGHDCLHEASEDQAAMSDGRVEIDDNEVSYSNSEQSLFSALSSNVKYWLGQGGYDKSARSIGVYTTLKVPICIMVERTFGIEISNEGNTGLLSPRQDDSDDSEMSPQDSHAMEEEGLNLVESFYSENPYQGSHPPLTKTRSEGDVTKVKRGFYGFKTKPGKAAKLNRILPSRTVGHCWELVYSTFQHGFSLSTLYRKMEVYDSPVLLGSPFCTSLTATQSSGNFGLWLDEDLYHGSSHPCSTFSSSQLSSQEDFLCSGLEAWTFV
ncbi:Nuclear receptor coactivator 7 [Acropora cervicornis]|uniref:Oxidation resistance protein 1 n=1 Tax=Acropora cervicornis TaxID=6130 RepID=A0AAD9Q860_ACRCE|nr:Nuclear receptor coactivator 7 [Acropora cervicornis]